MSPRVNQDSIAPRRARTLAREILAWYREQARDLPWRHSDDPYAIWVSEVMLQQTRVEVVRGRWQRFLDRFPDIRTLAEATEAEVLAEWAGLGYYRRVRSLHRAARELADRSVTRLPSTSAELRLLPGFGAYTAGAVASIAFGERVAAIDGNVERVLSRLLALAGDPARGEARDQVRALATALLDRTEPGELNQALMELGATVCTPRAPLCAQCPWEAPCRARVLGAQTEYPRRPPRRAAVDVVCFAAVARGPGGKFLFRRRPEGGHNAALWEFPSTGLLVPDPAPDPSSELRMLGETLGLNWQIHEALVSVRHTITHHRITVIAHAVEPGDLPVTDDLDWLEPPVAKGRGLTAAGSKILAALPTLL